MAIAFHCPACSQAIEIDEHHAGQQVVCPYCEKVVTAPSQSRPAPPPPVLGHPAPPQMRPAAVPDWSLSLPPLSSNRAGNWSLAAAVLAWLLFFVCVGYTLVVVMGIMPSAAAGSTDGETRSSEEIKRDLERAMRRFQESPEFAGQRATSAVLQWTSLALALAAVVLGAVGLSRRQAKKGTSIAGLVVSMPLLLCVFFLVLAASIGLIPAAPGG